MRVSNVIQIAGVAVAAFLLVGCAGEPTKVARDSTPSWMKQEVTGSRIRLRPGPRGQAASASFVTRVPPRDLALMPGVVIR